MAQKDLKPVRTKEEAKARGRAGGVKSGKVRKKKKQVKELLETLLKCKPSEEQKTKIQEAFPDVDIKTIEDVLNLSMINKGAAGDVQAYNAVYDRVEGKAQQKIEHSGEIGLAEIMKKYEE